MPGMDGIETARIIFELKHQEPENINQKTQSPIIITVTAYGHEWIQKQIDKAGIYTLLLKPIKPSQLCYTKIELLGQAEHAAACRAREPVVKPMPRLAGQRVLVVEDSELNQDVAVALLEDAGLAVEVAENGSIGVAKVTKSPRGYYDAVLMDIQMPVMDGYEATRKIREFEQQQDATAEQSGTKTPIIALTAHALKGEKEKCLAADMDDYLAKLLDEQDLQRVLIKWIAPQHDR